MKGNSAFSLLRILAYTSVIALMGLLYWSSSLLEQEVKGLRQEMKQLRGDLSGFQFAENTQTVRTRPHIDPALPNLLQEDPYFSSTLPDLLGVGFEPSGTLRSSELGRPHDLHPFSAWYEVRALYGYCVASLANLVFGTYEDFAPNLAIKIEERTGALGPEYWVHLRDKIFWEPLDPAHFPQKVKLAPHFLKRHPITSADFKFAHDAIMNPYVQEGYAQALRNNLADIEEFRIIDDLTFVVRWKAKQATTEDGSLQPRIRYVAKQLTASLSPLPAWVYQYFPSGTKIVDDSDPNTYRTNSVWAQNFSLHWAKNIIVSCGPWLFDGSTDQEVQLKRNTRFHSRYAALVDRQIIAFKSSPDAMWQDFKAGKLDIFNSRYAPQKVAEVEDFLNSAVYANQKRLKAGVERLDYAERSFRFVGWNQARPLFASKTVRQALTLAIDRHRIIDGPLGRMGQILTGPELPQDEAYNPDVPEWPYDPAQARLLLEQEGWADTDRDGWLDKEIDGERQKFSFNLSYFVHSQNGRMIADHISTSLREIGIECKPLGIDSADLAAAFDSKDFDAVCMGWAFGTPPTDLAQIWHSAGAKERGSSNAIGFASAEVDRIIEDLEYCYEKEKRIQLYRRFHEIIHDECPYTFLYVPKLALLYRDYVQNVFVPAERRDLLPAATVTEPISSAFWIKKQVAP